MNIYYKNNYKLCTCFIPADAIVSLEESEYFVCNERSPSIHIAITANHVISQDVIVEVTVKDGTAAGKQLHIQLSYVI